VNTSGEAEGTEATDQVQGFSLGDRAEDSAVSLSWKVGHKVEILDLFLGGELNATRWIGQ
jgi:hypothetical protein